VLAIFVNIKNKMSATARGAEDSAARRNLSKNVLQMKFMKRGKPESGDVVTKQKIDAAHWVIGGIQRHVKQIPYEFDTSHILCEELLPVGRMSYLNFNPLVQKTHEELLAKAKIKYSLDSDDEDLSDGEMAKRYESLIGTIAKKFQPAGKRKHTSKVDTKISVESNSDSESDEDIKQLKKRARRGFIKPKTD